MEKDHFRLFLRQIILDDVGVEGQNKIIQSKILIVGAGGIGCPVLTYLQRAGVGTIGVVDFDDVDITNIHRQFWYDPNDEGRKKTEVLREKIKPYDFQKVNFYSLKADENNLPDLVQQYDLVIDGTDNFKTRYAVNDVCVRLNKPLLSASILGYQIQMFLFDLPSEKNLRHIFPEPPLPGEVPACSENGVFGPVPGMAGMMLSLEALKFILKNGYMKDQFLVFDTSSWILDSIKI
ncbi:MAG: HesA/MoeB/ThiF family protein [Bacteroidia bacterium]|nr:HesA/MoeB/ThiF family protein [Bacteroidia bacterium]